MRTGIEQTVASGSMPVAMALALLAGVVSFASPCVLPLVPGFLAYVTGLTDENRRTRLVLGAVLFVLGFGAVIVAVAAAYGVALDATQTQRGLITRLGGVVVILLSLVYLGFIGQRGLPVRWRPAAGLVGAPVLGAVFGIGMSPCIGPVWGTIISLAAPLGDTGTVGRGVSLAVCYAVGLGIPFVLIAAGWARAERWSRWLRDHHRPIQWIGGALMLTVGVLMVAGVWEQFIVWMQANLVGAEGFRTII